AVAVALGARAVLGTGIDPNVATTIVVGASPGFAPMARVDPGRRGRSRDALPDHPKVIWRRPGQTSFDINPIAVDARGSMIAPSASLPELVELASNGTPRWRASTGFGPSIAGVVILNDGTRFIVTSAGDAVGFSPAGALRFRAPLDLPERNAKIGLLPLDGGGVAIAAALTVYELDGDGIPRHRTRLVERIAGAPVSTASGLVVTTASGTAYVVREGFAKTVGSLGGDPGEAGASTPDGRTLYAVVDHQRLVALDLRTGALDVRFATSDPSLHGPVVFGERDALVFTTLSGHLLRVDNDGGALRRTPLEAHIDRPVTDAGRVDFATKDESPVPLTDAAGRVAFARVGGRMGVVSRDGDLVWIAGPTCSSPAGLVPAGPRRFAVSCRDGTLLLLGDDQ
ncbi:MAG TPA: hypothetical protein VJT73_20145, partial [Polyangiaceae bacterium]|nr:hypothetical protein [Polyangiaceae bacterium]